MNQFTDEEMADIRDMTSHYLLCTEWIECDNDHDVRRGHANHPEHMANIKRRRALAKDIAS